MTKKLQNAVRRWLRRFVLKVILIVITASIALILPWRWLAPPTTAFMLRDQLRRAERIHQQWAPLNEISPHLSIAVVAAEDQKFPYHHGFDFHSIQKALQENRREQRGASTISQQLAKNLFLWPGRSLFRKALEAYLTIWIELAWPKRRILEVYLNVVEFGPAVYGVDAASRLFFNRAPGQVTAREAALLAAVLPNPKGMSAARPSQYVHKRALQIEMEMRNLGGQSYLPWL